MAGLLKKLRHLLFGDKGQSMVEYGLIIGLISVIVLGSLILFGNTLGDYFADINALLPDPP